MVFGPAADRGSFGPLAGAKEALGEQMKRRTGTGLTHTSYSRVISLLRK
jgi:hypothetical protein